MRFLFTLIWIVTYMIIGIGFEHITKEPSFFAAYGVIMGFIYTILQDSKLAV